uniref:putative reverse transcriptase/maturase n=1 Tax=Dixoniella grisea TaxID=35153 RepID=UPI001FCD1153|nr:putative reverse transcriptase/maturase [Dixoniella grisea]UNJ17061.1 putative reverse transcriptase/maturase [Dixoniella grisea]
MSKFAWETIIWKDVQMRVSRYQQRIYNASINNNRSKVRFLQKKLLSSLDAKLLAVFKVTTLNKGKKKIKIDDKNYQTSEQKMHLVNTLNLDGTTLRIKKIWLPKSGQLEKRPLDIPIIKDRAKQALCLFALEPEWEAKFEPNIYGFRPECKCHDAIKVILSNFENTYQNINKATYILDVDLSKYFNSIDHNYLLKKLDTLPEIEKQICAWLQAGLIEGFNSIYDLKRSMVPANQIGISEGYIISPLIINIILHGLATYLKRWIYSQSYPIRYVKKEDSTKQNTLTIVSYAYDFVVIHTEKELLLAVKIEIEKLLASTSKLSFNEQNIKIVSAMQGFQFLGFQIIITKRNGILRLKSYPSTDSQKQLLNKVREIIQKNKQASSFDLIKKLTPVILHWGNYFKYCECTKTFEKLQHLIFQKIRAWVFRRDKNNPRYIVKEKYFPSGNYYTFKNIKHYDNWVLVGQRKIGSQNIESNWLPKLSWIKSSKWIKVKGNKSIYDKQDTY